LTSPERTRLTALLGRYPELHRAWLLKESFRAWYCSSGRAAAEVALLRWEASARECGLTPFKALFPMLRLWRNEILNHFDYPYTNGFLEGKNNRMKVIKRTANGVRLP
jgi:transposase